MKKILWAGAALVVGACMVACDDSSSSTSFEIPSYKNEAALPDSCSMEVAKVDTAYFACFENKWVEVKDSAIVEQLKEGLDEEEVKAKLEELEELLKADTPATPAKPKSSSSEKTDENVESSDSEEPESSDSEEEECTGRHCKGDDSGSGSGSGSGKSSSSTGGNTSEEVKCVENGFKTLEDYVKWTSSSEGNRLLHGKKALVKKCVGDAKDDATALKNNLQHDTRYQCFAVTSLTGEAEDLYESLSMVFDVEVKVGDFVCEGFFSETVYAITLLKTETASSKFYAASAEMSGSTDEGSSASEGEGSSASEGDDSSSSEDVESSASVEESSSSEVESSSGCTDPAPNTTGRPDAVSFLDDYLNWGSSGTNVTGTFKCGVESAQVVTAVTGEGYGCIDETKGKGKQEQLWKKCIKTIGSNTYAIEVYSNGGIKPTFPVTVTVKSMSSAGRPEAFSFLDNYVVEWLSDKEATYVVKAADQMAAALAENGYRERTLTDEMLLTLREEFEFKMDASNAVVYVKLERKTDGKITVMVLYIVVYTTDGYLGVMIDEGSSS
ncbi:MAG: hypothetical protein IJ896_04125 [Fibrobacter sp.]|nr:hypothetical protein [Fibrobacter sp.]